MPIIIWGSRGLTSTVEDGEFYCPQCDAREEYTLKQVRPSSRCFSFPFFPLGPRTATSNAGAANAFSAKKCCAMSRRARPSAC